MVETGTAPPGWEILAAALAGLAAPLAIDNGVLTTLLAAVRPRTINRGDHVCRQGEASDALFFVRSGLLRYYYVSRGVEHTGQFFDAGMAVCDVHSLGGGDTALQNIDALEPSELLVVPFPALRAAFDADHGMERFGRRMIEIGMIGSQRRTAAMLQMTPTQRYERFVATRPEVARRLPLYVTASFLGITPEALSRIRRRRVATPPSGR